ncbi:MAG TPA: hypothetical protein GX503_03165 [Clostridiales bacterium]|nr:hypothetical protein [Clostridiales bacterium]
MAKEIEKEVQTLGKGKLLLIILAVFIVVPLTMLSLLYFTNENFQFITNRSLSKVPGVIGDYFSKFPTKEEREAQKKEVAQYLIGLDIESASDKLMLIQKEDGKLYSDLLKIMMQMDAAKTEQILERIREASIKKDVLLSTLEQIRKDQMENLEEKAKHYESLPLPDAVVEIQNQLMGGGTSYKDMARIIESMNEQIAAKILKNLDGELAVNLLSKFESAEKSREIEEMMQKLRSEEQKLVNIAQVYNEKKPEELVKEIGNTKKYKLAELSAIYRNMRVSQAAQVLAQVEDNDFISELFDQMKLDERLANGESRITDDLARAVKVYQDYNKKVNELVKIYSQMDAKQVGQVIATLFNSSNAVQRYTLNSGETVVITDQDLSIDILERLQPKKAGEILDTLEVQLASQISKRFTLVSPEA